jgi:hypothetical protein
MAEKHIRRSKISPTISSYGYTNQNQSALQQLDAFSVRFRRFFLIPWVPPPPQKLNAPRSPCFPIQVSWGIFSEKPSPGQLKPNNLEFVVKSQLHLPTER